jgi:glycosyltransferase involved in cell wall biosynthesis
MLGARTGEPAGWVVEPTVDALAAALPTAVADAPTRGAAARARYLATFSPAVVGDQLIAVYSDLAAARRR